MALRKTTFFISDLVSIVTAAYNSENWISQSIQSVLAQDYKFWELLIIIDAATNDRTEDIVNEFSLADPRIRLIKITNQRGLALSRNKGIEEAKGQYLAFLDSDDYWISCKLTRQIEFIKHHNYAFTCTGFRRISEDHTVTGRLILPPDKQTYFDILRHNFIPCLTVIIDRNIVPHFEFYEYMFEDFILWLQILKKTDACYCLKEDLARYRVVKKSRSSETKSLSMRWFVYRNIEKLNVLQSTYYLFCYISTAIFKRIRF